MLKFGLLLTTGVFFTFSGSTDVADMCSVSETPQAHPSGASLIQLARSREHRDAAEDEAKSTPVYQHLEKETFNGNRCIDDGKNANLPTGPYTIEAEVKPDSDVGKGGIVGWGDYGKRYKVNALRFNGNPYALRHYWWGNDLDTRNSASLADGSFHHVAVTFDGTTRRMYVDYKEIGSKTRGGEYYAATNTETFCIGKTYGGEYFKGQIKNVKIWDYAKVPKETIPLQKGEAKPSHEGKAEMEDTAATVHDTAAEKAALAEEAFAATARAQRVAAERATEAMGAVDKATEAQNALAEKAAVALQASTEEAAAEKIAKQKLEEEMVAREKASAARKIFKEKTTTAKKAAEQHLEAKAVYTEKASEERTAKEEALEAEQMAAQKAKQAFKAAEREAAAEQVVAATRASFLAEQKVEEQRKQSKPVDVAEETAIGRSLLQLEKGLQQNIQAKSEAEMFKSLRTIVVNMSAAVNMAGHSTVDVDRRRADMHSIAAQTAAAAEKAFAGTASAVKVAAEKAAEATAALRVAAENAMVAQKVFADTAKAERAAAAREIAGVKAAANDRVSESLLTLTSMPRGSSSVHGSAVPSPSTLASAAHAGKSIPKKEVKHKHPSQHLLQKRAGVFEKELRRSAHPAAGKLGKSSKAVHSFHDVVGADGAFLLSLERKPERAMYAESMLKAVGIVPKRTPATDARDTPQALLAEGCNANCTAVEAAIAHSHKRALEAASLRKENWSAIFEDDAVPVLTDGMTGSRWDEEFREVWSQVPQETKVVRLSWCLPVGEGHLISPPLGDGEMMLTKIAPPGMCTAAYMVHKDIIPRLLSIFPCNCALDCCLNWKFFESYGEDGKYLHFSVLSNLDMVGSTSFIKKADLRGLDFHGVMMQAFNQLGSTLEPSARDQFLK